MADIKKGSDLITTMGETEQRMKKLERQLAVPRRGASSITKEESNATISVLTFSGESVTLIATENCLMHFFLQIDAKISSGVGYVFIQDVDTATNFNAFKITGSTYQRYAVAPGSDAGTAFADYLGYDFVTDTSPSALNRLSGGVLTVPAPLDGWSTTAGPHTFRIGYQTDGGGGTMTFKNRKFFAWVQPF